jgi:myo-inositol-1(or 4)-monophosphatase
MLDFALDTARQAGDLLRAYYSQRHVIGKKASDIDLVTEADLASEQLIIDAIRARYPADEILSEEGTGDAQELLATAPRLWLVDPLDGTVNYAHGYPAWSVAITFAVKGSPVVAVCFDPLRDEVFWSERGKGAWSQGRRLQVSSASKLGDALVATGFPYLRASLAENNLPEFGRVMPRVRGVRRGGSAVLDLAYVAAGRLDGYWERYLGPWDWAAGWLLVTEAGGRVTDVNDAPWSLGNDHLVASNGLLHNELLGALYGAQRSLPRSESQIE